MLDDDTIARYARQIVVPGIGAAGQERLLAAVVLVVGHGRGAAQATLYLTAAGLRVISNPEQEAFDLVVVADASTLEPDLRSAVLAAGRPACWYRLDPEGFSSGVHPAAALPLSPNVRTEAANEPVADALHDAAACDLAALACAIVLGLPHRQALAGFTF